MPPPRKESINAPATVDSTPGSGSRMLTPDSAMWSSWRAEDGTAGRDDEAGRDKAMGSASSSRWEGLRRPSLNMLRSATSSSTHSQTPSNTSLSGTEDYGHAQGRWSTDEAPAVQSTNNSTAGGTCKRRLVRTLLNKAKGSS